MRIGEMTATDCREILTRISLGRLGCSREDQPYVVTIYFVYEPDLSLAKTLGVLSFTPLTMLQACAQAVDFKVGHHFGEGQHTGRVEILRGRQRN